MPEWVEEHLGCVYHPQAHYVASLAAVTFQWKSHVLSKASIIPIQPLAKIRLQPQKQPKASLNPLISSKYPTPAI